MRNRIPIGTAGIAIVVACLGASAFAPSTTHAPVKHTIEKNIAHASEVQNTNQAAAGYEVDGTASWYGASFHGRLDARGERFDENAMTAAHRTLPLNSLALVTNLENGRQVQVRITDRGPYAHRRVIDLSRAAADALGYTEEGVARVNVRAIAAP